MYQREVDVDMLNAVKSLLADISSLSPSSDEGQTLETSANTFFMTFHISKSTLHWYILRFIRRNLSKCPEEIKKHAYYAFNSKTTFRVCKQHLEPDIHKQINNTEGIQRRGT